MDGRFMGRPSTRSMADWPPAPVGPLPMADSHRYAREAALSLAGDLLFFYSRHIAHHLIYYSFCSLSRAIKYPFCLHILVLRSGAMLDHYIR